MSDVLKGKDSDPSAHMPREPEKKQRRPRKLAVGKDFDIYHVDVGPPTPDRIDQETRRTIVWTVLLMSSTFIMGSAGLGLYQGNFSALSSVWTAVGPIFGALSGFYFGTRGRR